MGERADEVTGADPLSERQAAMSGDDLEGGPSTSASSEDEEITTARAEIEQTRAELSETIDAIEEKLSPEHLKEQAKESVKQATFGKTRQALATAMRTIAEKASTMAGAASGAGIAASQRVKQNPVPMVAAGLSVAGLAVGGGMLRIRRRRAEQALRASYDSSLAGRLNQIQRTVGQVVGRAQSTAMQMTGQDVKRVNKQEKMSADQGRVALPWPRRLFPKTPLAVMCLVAGLGFAAALGALRRRTEGVDLEGGRIGSQTRPPAPRAQYTGSKIVKRLIAIVVVAVPAGFLAARRFRQSRGQEGTMTRIELVMAWLNNAYSMETGLVQTLQSHARDAQDFPQMQARIQQHVEETRRHADLVRGCIERRGGSLSGLKSGMATVVGKAQGVAMRPAQDKVVKNALADSSAEQLEISSYRALIAAARDLGDQETVAICQQILQDEEDMARFLDQNLPAVVTETMHRMSAATS